MATLNGSPILVDELPTYYGLLSALQASQGALAGVVMVLLYEYCNLILTRKMQRQRWKPSSVLYIFVRHSPVHTLSPAFDPGSDRTSAIMTFIPQTNFPVLGNFTFDVEPWLGPIIWWSVQGNVTLYIIRYSPADIFSGTADAALCPVPWF
ncbi:hypothetical protein J3A83DRAFT_4187020 [Scleroderma citrinum]